MPIKQALQPGDQVPQVGNQDQGEADREGGRWHRACWGPRNLCVPHSSNLLCFQLLTPLQGREPGKQFGSLRRQKELIHKQPRCSVKSPGRQKQKVIGFQLSKNASHHDTSPWLKKKKKRECLLLGFYFRREKMS